MDSFKLEANGVNALFIRSEVDLTEAVLQVTNLARVNFSTRWRQRRFHVQRIRTYNNHSSRDNPVFHFLATSCATAIAHPILSYYILKHHTSCHLFFFSTLRCDYSITAVIQINNNKCQSNLAKNDIAQLIMTSGTAHSCFVDIYHIRQVAARVAKLVLLGAFGTSFGVRGSRRGHQWYHSKKRCLFFHIGSPLWPLRYH